MLRVDLFRSGIELAVGCHLSIGEGQGDTFSWIEGKSKVSCSAFNVLDSMLVFCCI